MSLFSSLGKILGGVVGAATGGIGGALLSGGLNLVGSVMQNNSAKSIANNNNAVAIELSNTAHQREVKDLEAAGLNPILSAGGNGASVPNMQAAPVQNTLSNAVSSALQAAQLKFQIENMKKTNENIDADTSLKKAQQMATMAQSYQANTAASVNQQTLRSARVQANADEAVGELTREISAGAGSAKAVLDIARVLGSVLKPAPSGGR